MLKKRIDISQVLVDFKAQPLKENGEPFTLKTALLVYLMNAHRMNVLQGKEENARAFEAGQIIGTQDGKIELTQHQLDIVKKLVEGNRIELGQGQSTALYGLVVSQQILEILNEAEVVKDK